MVYAPTRRKLTVYEYQRMGEAGILHEDERVELLDGEIFEMPPIGDGHIGRINRLTFIFVRRIGDRAVVSVQNRIRLSDYSEPQPDLVVLRPRADFYGTGKAQPDDVLLLVEVAERSLTYDRTTKLPRYAAAVIREVCIVNLIEEHIEVYRDPAGDIYKTRTIHRRSDTLSPLALPDLIIRVEEILW